MGRPAAVHRYYDTAGRVDRLVEWGETTNGYSNTVDVHGDHDHRCTRYRYTNTSNWFPHGLPARTTLYAGAPNRDGTELSDTYRFYDGANSSASNTAATTQMPSRVLLTAVVRDTGGGVIDDSTTAHNLVSTITERLGGS